jgi:NO-binding membrane sensor protein with MHYT domain
MNWSGSLKEGQVPGKFPGAPHFIAMLAYEPNLPTGYDIPLTLASILVAVIVTGMSLTRFEKRMCLAFGSSATVPSFSN